MKLSDIMAPSRRRDREAVVGVEDMVEDLDLDRMEGRFLGAVGAFHKVSMHK
jgi:hypothetical protein